MKAILPEDPAMTAAERLRIARPATFDRRRFGAFAPSSGRPFELLP